MLSEVKFCGNVRFNNQNLYMFNSNSNWVFFLGGTSKIFKKDLIQPLIFAFILFYQIRMAVGSNLLRTRNETKRSMSNNFESNDMWVPCCALWFVFVFHQPCWAVISGACLFDEMMVITPSLPARDGSSGFCPTFVCLAERWGWTLASKARTWAPSVAFLSCPMSWELSRQSCVSKFSAFWQM